METPDLLPTYPCSAEALKRWTDELRIRDCETLWTLQPKVGRFIQHLLEKTTRSSEDEEHLASAQEFLRGLGYAQEAPYRAQRGNKELAEEQARIALQCLPQYERIRFLLQNEFPGMSATDEKIRAAM